MAISPVTAMGQTVDELTASIKKVEATIQEREDEVADAQECLASVVRDMYKSGDLGTSSEMDIVLQSDSIDEIIASTQYASSVSGNYVQTIESAKKSLDELADAKKELEDLKGILEAQIEARKRADSIHFCQWGESYSDVRYYCGTIGTAGCGLCAYTVGINILKGTNYTPDTLLPERGDWQGMDHYPSDRTGTPDGSTHAEWMESKFDIGMETIDNSLPSIREALSDNESVIVVLARGTSFKTTTGRWWSTGGHYVCIYRCDDQGFYVQDSASNDEEGTAVYYTDDEMTNMINSGTFIRLHN